MTNTMTEELININRFDIMDTVKAKAKENKVELKLKDKELNNLAEQSLNFRVAQFRYGKEYRANGSKKTIESYLLPVKIIEEVVVPEVLACAQGLKPTQNAYKESLNTLEKTYATIDLTTIPDDITDDELLDAMKYNGSIIRYNNNAIKFVPEYLSNQKPYKEDLFVELKAGTPFIHYTRDEVLFYSIEYLLDYVDIEDKIKYTEIKDVTKDTKDTTKDIMNDINKKLDEMLDYIAKKKEERVEQEKRCVNAPLTQEQEEEILVQSLDVQQRIRRNTFEKAFEELIAKMYVPTHISLYKAFLEKYSNNMNYIRFKVIHKQSEEFFNSFVTSDSIAESLDTQVMLYVMNPHALLDRILDNRYSYAKVDNAWVLVNKHTNYTMSASTLEELLVLYLIDPSVSINKERILRDIEG